MTSSPCLPDPGSVQRRPALRIGDAAPNFRARTTMGEVQLRDFRGRWLILFAHPADFTPVCTSEFIALARAADEFAKRDCDLLGLSVDSLYSHLAWIDVIRQRLGVTISFPIIEDPSMAIGEAYGMVDRSDPDSSSVRAVYFIDPDGIVRAMIWYPLSVGRSVDELLRMLDALQKTATGEVLAPEGWRPGRSVLLPAPQHGSALGEAGDELWFYRERPDHG
ncbi:peroxiredoxin [Sphingobium fuliginis]|uniref:peroxiredoxin n=1 Tax=Sphingobium fuliginis (strain ATCC 27551) TaxID=336203 RepID=UPI000C071398|nr:peroxiredoxin [Sphingobium fuliginis]